MHKLGIRTEAYITHGLTHVYGFEMPELPESKTFYARMHDFFGF
jgi:hypothetical protein